MINKNNVKQTKFCVVGMQGSGKTHFTKSIIKLFKNPLVYGVYPFEWENESKKIKMFVPNDLTLIAFNDFAGNLIKEQVENKTYDCLFIDDADLFFKNNFDLYPNINRLFISQRQLGLTLIFASKRPQNLSTKVYENSDFLIIFAVEGVNVKKYLRNLHEDMEELLKNLSREKHNFIIKKIGENPKLFGKIIKLKGETKLE